MKHRIVVYFLSIFSLLGVSSCASRAEKVSTGAALTNATPSASPTTAVAPTVVSAKNSAFPNDIAATPYSSPSKKRLSLDIKDSASSLYFVNERSGWVLLNDTLYRTDDGGRAWVKLNGAPLRNYKEIMFTTKLKGLALRDDWNTEKRSNTVLSTEDGGRSWREVLEMPTPIYTIDFITERIGYVSGRWQPIQYTDDGGRKWKELDGTEGLNYLSFTSSTEGWGYGGAIWRTEDAGETWTQVVPYESVADLWDAKFINELNGWMIGARRQLWHTKDGRTWQQSTTLPVSQSEFTAFDFISSDEGWIASEDGTVICTTNGGATWQVIANLGNSLRTIKFVDQLTGWAVSSQGKLLRTTDGGKTWVAVRL